MLAAWSDLFGECHVLSLRGKCLGSDGKTELHGEGASGVIAYRERNFGSGIFKRCVDRNLYGRCNGEFFSVDDSSKGVFISCFRLHSVVVNAEAHRYGIILHSLIGDIASLQYKLVLRSLELVAVQFMNMH